MARSLTLILALVLMPWTSRWAAAEGMKRDLRSYFVLAQRSASLKNFTLNGPCNIGVNCRRPTATSSCGTLTLENASLDEGSQLVGSTVRANRPGAVFWRVYSSTPEQCQSNATILDGSRFFIPPIVPDLDGDGVRSCAGVNNQCLPDFGDLYAACGFPPVLPGCDASKPVLTQAGGDCLIADDEIPGNGRCDLAEGTYGNFTVQNGASVQLLGGGYVFCSMAFGKFAELTSSSPSRVLVVNGDVGFSDAANVGPGPGLECGQLTLLMAGAGAVSFGRDSNINAVVCAPEALLRLGHNNNLTGSFFGDVVESDSNNRGFCCGPGPE
ncbi:MAG TPA: hypothetical protein VGR62_19065 [Candidatus Binatia bacterium]|nr:hypothetical protein [Candidatus Binatia bacterium]